ncbi:MAG: hypothetical protein HDR88_17740 [Bacteroides sp.]|nr:hypothetical protein [Bacteroides sp.]
MQTRYLFSILFLLLSTMVMKAQKNTLSTPDVVLGAGKEIPLRINLDNTADVVAVQFTISLPEGLWINNFWNETLQNWQDALTTDRTDSHTVAMNHVGLDDNGYAQFKAVLLSSDNTPIKGRTGAIMTIQLYADENLKEGTELHPIFSDVAIVANDGSNLATGFSNGSVTIAQNPDLEVSAVNVASGDIVPGNTLSLSWTVDNVGALPTTGGWSEQIFLEAQDGTTSFLAVTYQETTLPGGGVMQRNAEIELPEILGVDGNCRLKVVLTANYDAGEPYWLTENNIAYSATEISVAKHLYLSPLNLTAEERYAQELQYLLNRSGSTAKDETFTVSAPSDGRMTIPQTVTIPKNNSGVYFYVGIKPNGTLDEISDFPIIIEGNDYEAIEGNITIEDDTFPSLQLAVSSQEIEEGENIEFTITTLRAPIEDLEVILSCNLTSRFKIPSPIIITAGSSSVNVTVEAIDDDIPDIERDVVFTASAPGQQPTSVDIILADNDIPALELTISPKTVSEGDGPLALTGTLRRTDNIDKLVTIRLEDDSEGAIYFPVTTFEMQPGVEEMTFNFGLVDNNIVDGERNYNISASVFIRSCSCNATNGKSGGTVTVPITVIDNDGPMLSLTASTSVLQEGGELTATISRNTIDQTPLQVVLSSDHSSELEFPETLTIPAGQPSTDFNVKSKSNTSTGDGFNATLYGEAEGFAKATLWFTISDQTLPDAQLSDFNVSPEETEANSFTTANITLSNTGAYELPELTKVEFFFSNSSEPIATYYLQNPLAPGETVIVEKNIEMPAKVGKFNLYATVNRDHSVKELNYGNNTSAMIDVTTVAPFSSIISTDKTSYKPGEEIKISGKLVGIDTALEKVEIYVINSGYRHKMIVETDENGEFSSSYTPFTGQYGKFAIGACYPGENLMDEMSAFNVFGINRTSNDAITCEATLGENFNGNFEINNPCSLPLTGLKVEVMESPANCEVIASCNDIIEGGKDADITFHITPLAVTETAKWQQIELNVTSNEGVSLPVTIYYYCRLAAGQLKASVQNINTTMIKGTSRDYVFELGNLGKGETGKITLALPDWMTTATPKEMASLASGETVTVILRLTPDDDMQLNVPVSGSIGINCANGSGLSLPYYIEPVSESKGMLTIDVCDENTYYTAEAPHLRDAEITIAHPTTGVTLASGVTGDDGKYSVELPEGYYSVYVKADKHDSYRNNLMVDPGKETIKVVNLSFNAITVDWNVEETEIEDEYEIVTTVNFETSVPVPVVETTAPSYVPAKDLMPGESLVFYVTMTNRGLITAKDVELELPDGFKTLTFEKLAYADPFSLAPNQSIQIPIKVSSISPDTRIARENSFRPMDDDPCASQLGTLYFWDCGPDRKWHRYGVALQVGTCKSDDPSTWDNSGNGSYGGSGSGGWSVGPGAIGGFDYFETSDDRPNVPTREDKGCEPCQNGIIIAAAKCASHFVGDAVDTLKSLMNLFNDDEEKNNNNDKDNGNNNNDDNKIKDIIDGFDDFADNVPGLKPVSSTVKGLYALLEQIAGTFDTCVNASADFDGVHACYKSASDAVDQLFDETLTESLGELVPAEKLSKFKSVGKKMLKYKKWIDIAADCAKDFVHACDHVNNDTINLPKAPAMSDYTQSVMDNLDIIHKRLEAFGAINDIMWGPEDNWDEVSFEEMEILNSIDYSKDLSELSQYKPESISHDMFREFCDRRRKYMEGEMPDDVKSLLRENLVFMQTTHTYFNDLGYDSPADYTNEHVTNLQKNAEESSSSVCASITLQFDQKMVMTRQAFRGTLSVFNGNEDTAMENVRLNLVVKDSDGNVATSHEFQINPESLDGFNGNLSLSDGWSLAPGETGNAKVLFIPTKYAAPTTDKPYSFGGSLSYLDPFSGLEVTRELFPVTLTVKPLPNLNLTYFMQRDIFGDDPLTETIEPSAEAEFSLLIHNVGYGEATDIRMVTEQPKIIDNEKGLAIDFEIISSQLNGGDKDLALGSAVATQFGNIKPMETAYAQWWFKSSMVGHFTKYDVKATHVSSYDNPDLSLLNEVTIHELIRSLEAEKEGNRLKAFMTNDIADANDTPDMVYLSDGSVESVQLMKSFEIKKTDDNNYLLSVIPAAEGWNYSSVMDPTYGVSEIVSVVRKSDGKEISLRNFWQTDRTLCDGKDPIYENRIHFADYLPTTESQEYVITFTPAPELLLEVASIEGTPLDGKPVKTPLEGVNVMFNKHIDPSTFTSEDIEMAIQGEKIDVSGITITTEDNKTFHLDLSAINKDAVTGFYTLTVNTESVVDAEGFPGKNGKTAGWNYYPDGSVLIGISVYPKNAGSVKRNTEDGDQTITESSVINSNFGDNISLTAIPAEGYEFEEWTIFDDSYSSDKEIIVVAISNNEITAIFSPKSYAVEIDTFCEGGTITGTYSGIYPFGEELTFIAVPDNGYEFTNWIVNGETLKENAAFNYIVTGETTISAVFSDITGIDTITADSRIVIYSIDGLLISSDASVETIRNLEKGIYIVNGVKYIVR